MRRGPQLEARVRAVVSSTCAASGQTESRQPAECPRINDRVVEGSARSPPRRGARSRRLEQLGHTVVLERGGISFPLTISLASATSVRSRPEVLDPVAREAEALAGPRRALRCRAGDRTSREHELQARIRWRRLRSRAKLPSPRAEAAPRSSTAARPASRGPAVRRLQVQPVDLAPRALDRLRRRLVEREWRAPALPGKQSCRMRIRSSCRAPDRSVFARVHQEAKLPESAA